MPCSQGCNDSYECLNQSLFALQTVLDSINQDGSFLAVNGGGKNASIPATFIAVNTKSNESVPRSNSSNSTMTDASWTQCSLAVSSNASLRCTHRDEVGCDDRVQDGTGGDEVDDAGDGDTVDVEDVDEAMLLSDMKRIYHSGTVVVSAPKDDDETPPEVNTWKVTGDMREWIYKASVTSLNRVVSETCPSVFKVRGGWRYVRSSVGSYGMAYVHCSAIPECGSGVWTRIYDLNASSDKDRVRCPAGTRLKVSWDGIATCAVFFKRSPVCVAFDVDIPSVRGAKKVCVVAETYARHTESVSRSYITVAAKNDRHFSGLTLLYDRDPLSNPMCTCLGRESEESRKQLMKHTRHVRYFGRRNGTLSLTCAKHGRVQGDYVTDYGGLSDVGSHVAHSFSFAGVRRIQVSTCSVLLERSRYATFGIDKLLLYVQ